MKIRIWQQFSSNHSGNFQIVGQFATAEQAQQAEQELRKLFTELNDWISKNYGDAIHHNERRNELTPIEIACRDKYGIEWKISLLEWLLYAHDDGRVDDIMSVFENQIFIGENNTMSYGYPLNNLLAAMGAKVLVSSELSDFTLNVTIIAPDETTANAIHAAITTKYDLEVVPWLWGMPDYQNRDSDELERRLTGFYNHIWIRQALNNNPQQEELRQKLKDEISAEIFEGVMKVADTPFILNDPEMQRLMDRNMGMQIWAETIDRDGVQIDLQKVGVANIAIGFPAFLAWLHRQGCTVTYIFEAETFD